MAPGRGVRPVRSASVSSEEPSQPSAVVVRALLLALTVVAFGFSLWSLRHVYPHLTSNNDEAVYVFQAELFRSGQTSLPLDQAELTRPWMSGEQLGRLIMVFPPTWPLLLAASGLVFGTVDVAAALVVALLVPVAYLLGRELTGDRVVGLVAAVVLSLSPLVLIHGATRLSYLFALLLELVIAWLVARAARRGWRGRELLGAGVAAGVLFSARPFDTILYAAAVAVFVVVAIVTEGPGTSGPRLRRLASVVGWTLAGMAGPVLAVLAYNRSLSGNPLRFPLHAVGGENAFGFGPRRIVDGAPLFDVTPSMAATAARLNLGELPHWTWGSLAALPLVLWGLWVLWRVNRAAVAFFVALGVVIPLGFFFYWGNVLIVQGRAELGPHYYLALLVPFAVAVSAALVDLARRAGPVVAVGVAVALTLLTVAVELPPKYERASRVTASSTADLDAVAAATAGAGPAVVILPASPDGSWILHPRGHLANEPDLGGDVVYVAEDGPATFDLYDRFPGRRVLRLTGRQPDSLMTRPPDAVVVPVEAQRAPSFELVQEVVNIDGAPVVTAWAETGRGGQRCVLDRSSVAGRRYALRWAFDASGAPQTADCPEPLIGTLPPGDDALVVGASFGDGTDPGREPRVDQRIVWRGAPGGVELLLPPEVRRFDRGEVRPFDTTHETADDRLTLRITPAGPPAGSG